MSISLAQLMACTGAGSADAAHKLDAINAAMAVYAIDATRARVGMYLANVGVETLRLTRAREIWGPTSAQLRYDGRGDLGNVRPGDGQRYMGRGDLQTTGRANYRALTRRLLARGIECPDFEAHPEALELPQWSAMAGCDYWDMRRLNALADRGAFVDVVKAINGGTNALQERWALWNAAQAALATYVPPVKPDDGYPWGNEERR